MTPLVQAAAKPERLSARWWKPLLGSFVFHGLMLGLLAGAVLLPLAPRPRLSSGSPDAVMVLSLGKLPVPAPAPAPVPPMQEIAPPAPAPAVAATRPPPQKEAPRPAPAEGVSVLPPQAKPIAAAPRPPAVRTTEVTASRPTQKISTSALRRIAPVASSFAAGDNSFPHPPYPDEARERHEIGTVKVEVRFDGEGCVAHVAITESSGSLVLDHSTTSYIRANWHSLSEAGQTVSVPVRYVLENMYGGP